jgi:2-polyprenyl-3-methyl-5-hydroxy-6-metoxy-1,4-benzoquinol methylase
MEAVKLITAQQPKALDIAAGALIEARDMLGKGFNVTAIDSNPDLLRITALINSDKLQAHVSTMEDFQYGSGAFDFIWQCLHCRLYRQKSLIRRSKRLLLH